MSQTTNPEATAPAAVAPTSPHRRSNGGIARAAALSAEDRTRISQIAARARHAKARHRACAIPRLAPSARQAGGLEPALMVPVEFVRRLGVHKDLLRWFVADAPLASAGVAEGDVILVTTAHAAVDGGLHATARDGVVSLGRVTLDGQGILFRHADGVPPSAVGGGALLGRVVGRMGRFGDI